MSKNNTRDGLNVSPAVLELANKIKDQLKLGAGGVAEDLGKDFYASTLPDGISMADVNKIQKHDSNLVAATALALGEESLDYFKKHKDVQSTSVELKAGANTIAIQADRYKSFPNRMGGADAPNIEKHVTISARYTAQAAGNRGEFKKVREHIGNLGAELFGKK